MFDNIVDVMRIKDVALANDVEASRNQAYQAWSDNSESMAAGWLMLPESDEELWLEIGPRLREIVDADL